MNDIAARIRSLHQQLDPKVKLVAVSKFHPVEDIKQAYDAGQRIFGESRVQELVQKQPLLPTDIGWHFIGSLQRNKVKFIAPFVACIHSLDSERLMLEIERQAAANNRTIPCLVQLHIAQEETKSGFLPDEARQFLKNKKWKDCPHVQIAGVMAMATYTDDEEQIRSEFKLIRTLFDEFKADFFSDNPLFAEISMGMSGDYKLAVDEGSTMVRIGSSIFGNRY